MLQAAPVTKRVSASSDQRKCSLGWTIRSGAHTSDPKSPTINVIVRMASRAWRLLSIAPAARTNAAVVTIAQNIWPGGIHLGTARAVWRSRSPCPRAKEAAQTPSPRRAARLNKTARFCCRSSEADPAMAPKKQREKEEEAASELVIEVGGSDEVGNTGQRETQIDQAKHNRRWTGRPWVHDSKAARDLSSHNPVAQMRTQGQAPDVVQILPGRRVMPKQGDRAEEHAGCAKDRPATGHGSHSSPFPTPHSFCAAPRAYTSPATVPTYG